MAKHVAPSIKETAFNCPYCGALATQSWFRTLATSREKATPDLFTMEEAENFSMPEHIGAEEEANIRSIWRREAAGEIFVNKSSESEWAFYYVSNVHFSKCFNCERPSLWIYDRLIWPSNPSTFSPSEEMPADSKADFEEAAAIVDASPRGAAALLRLSVQKLCKFLGGEGKNINDDIALLVARGLDVRVQRALDVVRVIGNNAVHPGEIDLRDNRDTASQLFSLVNIIVEAMITQPAQIEKLYGALPQGALAAIEKRDGAK